MREKRTIVVGATGASGMPLLEQCLRLIREQGTFSVDLIVPCSMKTIAGIHAGYGENLLLRAADVTLKEGRRLVLAARESPLSPIHLRNLYELSMIPGVRIIPPMMTFYHKPETIQEMVYHTAARLVEPFGIEAPEYRRWRGLSPEIRAGEEIGSPERPEERGRKDV